MRFEVRKTAAVHSKTDVGVSSTGKTNNDDNFYEVEKNHQGWAVISTVSAEVLDFKFIAAGILL